MTDPVDFSRLVVRIRALTVKPSDHIIIELGTNDGTYAREIAEIARAEWPDNRIVVLSKGTSLTTQEGLKPAPEQAEPPKGPVTCEP